MAEDQKKSDSPVAEVQKVAGMTEKMGCACLNLGCLLVILAIIFLIAGLLDIFTIKGLSNVASYAWDATKSAILSITE